MESETTIDLPEIIHIKVEQRHIDNGKREDCSYCPIALAIMETIPSNCLLGPFWKQVKVHDSNEIIVRGITYNTSRKVSQFICDFDSGKEVEPMDFVLSKQERDEYEF